MDPNQAQDKEVAAKDAKGGWIAAIAIPLVAIGTIAGVIVGTNNELAKKDDEIAKTYVDELGLINVCTPDGTGSKKISEL